MAVGLSVLNGGKILPVFDSRENSRTTRGCQGVEKPLNQQWKGFSSA
jgi:hypothetical protein